MIETYLIYGLIDDGIVWYGMAKGLDYDKQCQKLLGIKQRGIGAIIGGLTANMISDTLAGVCQFTREGVLMGIFTGAGCGIIVILALLYYKLKREV
jgi:hypothetical protein